MTYSRCPRPAQIRVDERIVLCAECWNEIFERLKADFNSITCAEPSPHVVPAASLTTGTRAVAGDNSSSCESGCVRECMEATDSAGSGIDRNCEDTTQGDRPVAAVKVPFVSQDSFDDGIPVFLRRVS